MMTHYLITLGRRPFLFPIFFWSITQPFHYGTSKMGFLWSKLREVRPIQWSTIWLLSQAFHIHLRILGHLGRHVRSYKSPMKGSNALNWQDGCSCGGRRTCFWRRILLVCFVSDFPIHPTYGIDFSLESFLQLLIGLILNLLLPQRIRPVYRRPDWLLNQKFLQFFWNSVCPQSSRIHHHSHSACKKRRIKSKPKSLKWLNLWKSRRI